MRLTSSLALLALSTVAIAAPPAGAQASAAGDSLRRLAVERLAQLDGATAVPGLDSAVEVRRDRWGVPHIYARTQHDLFFAQGYVAAQDRLWQMEMWRRAGEGRLAEVLGPAHVERDRFARLFRYRGDVDAEWRSYAPDARAIGRAFVDGVNAYIAQVQERPPVEFEILGFRPTPWPYDAPLQRMGALAMTGNALSEIEFAELVRAVGPERAARLRPPVPWRPLDPAAGVDLEGVTERSLGAAKDAYGAVAYKRLEGSNNWVVSGAKTASGRPLLANDPHRLVATPSLRYLTHLVGPGWNVIGAGEPGVPGVAAGHNERVGFGFTIVGMDQQDVYVERVGPCLTRPSALGPRPTSRCYLHDGRWKPIRTIVDTIPVRGDAPRIVPLEYTVHGPIVSLDTAKGRAFVVRFVGTEPGTAGYLAQLSVDRARDWRSFLAAARRWKLPTENLVYADVDGHIGWVAAGLMPLRSWSGLLPVPGTGSREWRGFLPFDSLPRTFDPPSGVIVTANNDIRPPGYRHPLSYEWAAPFRARRIRAVLDSGSRFTVADFQRLQHDELSLPARAMVPALLRALPATPASSARAVAARELDGWDYAMRKDAVAPTIYAAWEDALGPRLAAALLGADTARVKFTPDIELVVRAITAPEQVFGADAAVARERRDSIAAWALDDALARLSRELGSDPARWRWGTVHKAAFRHPVAAAFDLPAASRGGYGDAVYSTSGPGFSQTHGASFREILDVADWDNSVATSTPGQSGQPGSAHYGDLLKLWEEGRYFPLVYSRERVEQETAHRLVLEPARP
ncbi:MAG: penicillin acylase family protein [Gemmatimonadaceae bacterium]